MTRCACIDIGSNTTRLLVAERRGGALAEVAAVRAFTRLRADRAADGTIPPERIAATAQTVAEQARLAREHGAEHVRVVATAAIRGAPNGAELCAAVRAAAGLAVDVLSGEEEARHAFAGAMRTLPDPPGPDVQVGVVDVGGGSSELVCGTVGGGVGWSASLPVGSGVLADAHLRSDPPSHAELAALRAEVAEAFAAVPAPQPQIAYAVGGSATSLRRLLGPELTRDTLRSGLELLAATPAAEVARRFDLHAERVRLLPAGLIVLDEAAAALGAPLRISRGGLREGVILEALGQGA